MTKLERMKKQAAMDWNKLILPAAAASLASGVTLGVIPAIEKAKHRKDREIAWAKIKAHNPELASAAGTRENFEAMHDITPRMMKYPSFAIPILRQAKDYDSEGIPVQLLQVASQAEHGSQGFKSKRDVAGQLGATAANLLSKLE